MVFDGKNKQVLRKYSLRLKNTLKQMNEGKKKGKIGRKMSMEM